MPSEIERIAVLETKAEEIEGKLDTLIGKVDELISIKHKGAGALMLAGIILTSGLFTAVVSFFQWFWPKA